MDIKKANWYNTTDSVNLSVSFTKVDKERRIVSGFATLDNEDRHGDIVPSDASEEAFSAFAGNLREMHQPIAVGRVVNFTPKQYVDTQSGEVYKGIYVDAYISKGAQDTWEKILDKTYTGFSIGGNILETGVQKMDDGNTVRVIKRFELHELSVVDTPANPLAAIVSIQKGADGNLFTKGLSSELELENVFWCSSDQVATTSNTDALSCLMCNSDMDKVGWVEKSDTQKTESIMKAVDTYLLKDAEGPSGGTIDSNQTINIYPSQNGDEKDEFGKMNSSVTLNTDTDDNTIRKGGNEMADETVVVEEATPVEEIVEVVETPQEEAVEKALSVSEVPTDELDFVKMVDGLRGDMTATMEKNFALQSATIGDMFKVVEVLREEFAKSLDGAGSAQAVLTEKLAAANDKLDQLTSRLDAIESSTAIKKSYDAQAPQAETTSSKSIWGGHFLNIDNL